MAEKPHEYRTFVAGKSRFVRSEG